MTSFAETVASQIRMLEAGQVLSALDHYLADFGVVYLNGAIMGEGLAACRAEFETVFANTKNISSNIDDLHIDTHSEFCVFRSVTTYQDSQDQAVQNEALHVQMWTQGKIAIEWRYTGEPMQGMIARGILKDPAHILELTG